MKFFSNIKIVFLLLILSTTLVAQLKDTVEVTPNLTEKTILKKCKSLVLGKVISTQYPIYPDEARSARIGGTVSVEILIDEKGSVLDIININGKKELHEAAKVAALKAKFTPTLCDGQVARVNASMIYNFIPYVITDIYFTPKNIEEFTDISSNSDYYEPIFFLTENYKLAFGYGDKKFHSDAPLTKGDFVHFLRLTLDLLHNRAKLANKFPAEIGLFKSYNPYKLKSTDEIIDFENKNPYAKSLRFLVAKYNIGIVNEKKQFNGNFPLTQNEVIDYWTNVFGKDAIPVHFQKITNGDKIFTRGEFALFLQESLYVLTYKVLP